MPSIPFVEADCSVGGVSCGAWSDWFWAGVEADPGCQEVDEDGEFVREPVPLTDHVFDPRECANAQCTMRCRALEAQ